MGEKIVVGPINKGIRTDRLPFNIDNDSFPVMVNAYQWRGRVKRRRGTSFLTRLERYFNSSIGSYGNITSITLDGSGNGNLITGFAISTLSPNAAISPGTVTLVGSSGPTTYTDPTMDGYLTPTGTSGPNTINYATGAILIPAQAGQTITAIFDYYPDLPVMGLEALILQANQYPLTLAFDTTYSYNIATGSPYTAYDVSFYKNPAADGVNYPGYTPKTNSGPNYWTPVTWNGQSYQQFWTVNYQGALWATNGIAGSTSLTSIGMQYAQAYTPGNNYISAISITSATTVEFTITGSPLVVGDFVFANEFTGAQGYTINFQTGYVTVVAGDVYTVVFPEATISGTLSPGGILQYLTNRSNPSQDCIRWYDGDPTGGINPPDTGMGWVNFMPPIEFSNLSIDDAPSAKYYLVGAVLIYPFKDRLLFIGPVIQTSSPNSQIYLQDTIIFSQNATPYYTCSFAASEPNSVLLSNTVFYPILTPSIKPGVLQPATANSYFCDVSGFGGFISAGIAQPILSVSPNEDVLLVGFSNSQTRVVYTGNDLIPFNFFIINSELGVSSTFSVITLDRGAITIGEHGIELTTQTNSQRIDLQIPDEVFEFTLTNNGAQKVTAQRDFINEWIYFSFLSNSNIQTNFNNTTLLYNYRDESWGIYYEVFSTYGQFRRSTGDTWATIGEKFSSWAAWNEPWNAGSTTLLSPEVICGTPQGFVMTRDSGTSEGNSIYIENICGAEPITGATQANPCVLTCTNTAIVGQWVFITGVRGMVQLNNNYYQITAVTPTTITINVNSTTFGAYISGGICQFSIYSVNHCLNSGDYIVINNCLGTIGQYVNGNIYSVEGGYPSTDFNNFFLNPDLDADGTYFGNGVIQKMYAPFIQTKQFPTAWQYGRKTRIGFQQYLLSTTAYGQMTLFIYLSQDNDNPYNYGPIVPSVDSINNSLIYSTILYTCPESTNIGLTPANINLQTPTATSQSQIWHRVNTSLIGDTVQLGFTLSDAQMRDPLFRNQFSEIELHAFIIDVSPSQMLV